MRTWLLRPHVRRWYDDVPAATYPDDAISEYRSAIRGEDPTDLYLIKLDGRAIGELQSYRIDDHPEYAAQVALSRPALIRAFLRDVAFPRYLEPDSREQAHYLMELMRADLDAMAL